MVALCDVDADLDDGRGDEHVDLAGGEGAHGARPSRRARSRPCSMRDAQPGQRPGGQLGVDVLDRGQRPLAAAISAPSSSTSTWSVSPSSRASPLIRGHTT